MKPITILTVLFLLVLQGSLSPAHAQEPPALATLPGGAWMGVSPIPEQPKPDPSWAIRTGFRKGVIDQTLAEEIKAGPDIAVLQNGLSNPWKGLLAGFRETSVAVDPGDVAGLFPLKPVLVIPSGGLSGLRSSVFFHAGLAEYIRSGGVALCFSQQNGPDLAALPGGSDVRPAVTGLGWSEDSGSLFQASLLRASHPALASLRKTAPFVETDGYLTTTPKDGRILLSRGDGNATLLVYPFGKGWVVVTTLMSDLSFSRGQLHDEERDLVRDLVRWAKAGGKVQSAIPGETVSASLKIAGPESGTATTIGVRLVGPTPDIRRDERLLHVNVAAGQTAVLAYSSPFPRDAVPGIYHLEYRLHDGQRVLSPWSESGEGWFTVPATAAVATTPPGGKNLDAAPLGISVLPSVVDQGGGLRLRLDIRKTAGTSESYDLFARAAGQVKYFKLTNGRAEVTFETARADSGGTIAYAIYHAGGRSLARGGIDAGSRTAGNVTVDQPWYQPGQKARIAAAGLGLGAFAFTGLGAEMSEHISSNRTFDIVIPGGLPTGLYPLSWSFQTRTGGHREGTVPVSVNGVEVNCTDIRWEPGTGPQGRAMLRIQASAGIATSVRLRILDPSGKQRAEQERTVTVAPGSNDVSVDLPSVADRAGIWSLRYDIAALLPEGPGFSQEPMPLLSGRLFFDVGEAVILSLATDRPVYYEARGPVVVTATALLRSKTSLELLINGKRMEREKFSKPGIATIAYTADRMAQGAHRIAAATSGSGPGDVREATLVYGARLPDLIPIIQTSAVKAPDMEIGVGVTNRGKVASGKTKAALYEGDPSKGAHRIATFEVPPLEPGAQHVIVVPWPLKGKAGEWKITAVIDSENAVLETDKSNNLSSLAVAIPEVLLEVVPAQESFAADGEISYTVEVANFTSKTIPLLALSLHIIDPAGKTVSKESIPVVDFESGGMRRFERTLGPGVPQEGIYLVEAQTDVSGAMLTSDSVGLVIRPTLSVKGSLAGTSPAAAPCQPLMVRYSVRNGGNVPFTSGALKLEIRSAGIGQLVHAIQLPLTAGEQTHRINRIDLPKGAYRISLRASAVHQPSGMSGEFLLDERPVSVREPVLVTPAAAPFPRLLVWTGGESDTSIERALTEKMLREAFDQEGIYIKTVTSAEAFSREALTGLFTIYLLIDIDSTLDAAETLRAVLGRGHVVVIAGSNDRSRSLAEQFKIVYAPASDASYITFPGDSPLGLNGTLPFSRPAFSASRKGSRALAVYSNDQSAVLIAPEGEGKLVLMPFSLIHSALAAGTSTPFSLLVRAIVFSTVPGQSASGPVSSAHFSVTAAADPVAAKMIVPLPEGTKLLWANRKSSVANGSVVFELTADKEPRRIMYLLQTGKTDSLKKTVDVQYKCDNAYVSQGKVE